MAEHEPSSNNGDSFPTKEQYDAFERFSTHVRWTAGIVASTWGRNPEQYSHAEVHPRYDPGTDEFKLLVYGQGDTADTRIEFRAAMDPISAQIILTPRVLGYEITHLAEVLDTSASWLFGSAQAVGAYYSNQAG